MPKYSSAKDLRKAIEAAEKDRAVFESRTEKVKAEIASEKERLAEEIAVARMAADFEQFEALSKKVNALDEKLSFYDDCRYTSPINDADVAQSWIAIKKSYDAKEQKMHDAFLKTLDEAISQYRALCRTVSDEICDWWVFHDALDHSKFTPGGFPEFDFPDPDRPDMRHDFDLGHRLTEKNNDAGYEMHQLTELLLRGIPLPE